MTEATDGKDSILYLVGMNPEPAYEEKFNCWYDTEHAPELLELPGWRSVQRYRMRSGQPGSPRYLAVYDLAGPEAFESDAYLAYRRAREDDRSPLDAEIREHRTRQIAATYEQILHLTQTPRGRL